MRLKKNKRPNVAIYQFPYYRSDRGFLRIFLTKALFACALAFSGAGLFTVVLELEPYISPIAPAALAAFVCLINFVLLGFFRKLYVAIFDMAVFILFFSTTQLPMSSQDMLYQIFLVSDGNIVRTAGILSQSELKSPLPFFMALVFIYGMMCAFASCHRFRPLSVMTLAEIMMIPAFLGQSLHFSWWLGVLIASMLGLWAITAAAGADAVLSSNYTSNLHMSDYVYFKANKKLTHIEKLRSDSFHFGRYLSHGITVIIVTLITMGVTASSFPTDGSMRLEDIAMEAMNLTQSLGYWLSDVFGSTGLKGFFSADGGDINISGNINPEDLPTGNRPVAEIITENKDKLYLRGDIGYTLKGERWESIYGLDYGSIYTDSGISMEDVLNSCAPEMQYYLMRYVLGQAYSDGYDYIKQQIVKVNYLQDINTLLVAGTPYVFNGFRENDNFSIYGDFVAIADKGRVNSMRTAMLYCNTNYGDDYNIYSSIRTITSYRDFHRDTLYEIENEWGALPMQISYSDYTSYISAYRDFVYDYYTDVPEEEKENIYSFLLDAMRYGYDEVDAEDLLEKEIPMINALSDMYYRNMYAEFINEYLSSSGTFRYSLDTDNTAGGNTFLGNFLNETRAGHCALYATTMCLALRYIGVPARYVTGFTVSGDNDFRLSRDGGYSYTVLEKDLHAWVEVYYDDVGWIPYDPTPAAGRPGAPEPEGTTAPFTRPTHTTTSAPVENTTTTTRPPIETTTAPPSEVTTPTGGSGGSGTSRELDPEVIRIIIIISGSVLAVLLIALSIAGALKNLRRKERTLIKFFRTGDPVKAVAEMLTFTLKILDMKKIRRKGGETPTEFAKRADGKFGGGSGVGLEQAMPLFERAEFDDRPGFTEEERQEVYGAVSKLYGVLMEDLKAPNRLMARIKLFGRVKPGKEK